MIVDVSGTPVIVIRKEIKNIHLYVKAPDGHVEVTAPNRLSDESIILFVRTRLGWVHKQQEKFAAQERQSPREYVSGETIYLFGKGYYLHILSGTRYSINLNGDDIYYTTRAGSTSVQRERWINEWYRTQLKGKIEKLLPKWEQATGLYPTSWQIRYMTTRWGTCNTSTGKICLNLQLAKKGIECIDYVILHELVHLSVHNHDRRFTTIMDTYMPYWRDIKKKLNDSKLDYMPLEDNYIKNKNKTNIEGDSDADN